MTKFKHVIIRRPGKSLCDGITSAPELGQPIYERAIEEHYDYEHALEQCGVDVTVLPALEQFPDSCFVEDPAVITRCGAIITNPGAPSRNGEKAYIVEALRAFYPEENIEYITEGTIEGGDVMMVGDHYYVGLSRRTNEAGFENFRRILEKYGMTATAVPVRGVLHLKTGVDYLSDNRLLAAGEFIGQPVFSQFDETPIAPEEAYAVNCLFVNGKVLVPAGFPKTEKAVRDMGYETIQIDTSEYRKIDGGPSCLSLRF